MYNPNIATPIDSHNEVFTPNNGHFDFHDFTIKSDAKNFTAKTLTKGHYQLIDNTGNITINVLSPDKMFNSRKDKTMNFLKDELKKPSFTVGGVEVHEIEFRNGDMLYASCMKNSTSNMVVYISTPSEVKTAEMMNSLEFKD